MNGRLAHVLTLAVALLLANGCDANPTPHPANDAFVGTDSAAADTGGDAGIPPADAAGADTVPVPDVSLDVGAGDAAADIDPDGADTTDTADTAVDAAQSYACGASGLMCESDEACQGTGQGACIGPEPGPNGCGSNCYAEDCGGGTVCLCSSFQCVALPTGCSDCSCATPPFSGCVCDDSKGYVAFDCPGA